MNTPAHAIIGLLVFGRERRAKYGLPIIVGSLIPDAPMVIFYIWARIAGISEREIWRDAYFDPGWQAVFDAFHSFPLLALAWLAAWRIRLYAAMMVFSAMIVHALVDFPLHHDDAHRHFWPLSDWRFASPVSYWDPAHFGAVAAPIELLLVVAGGAWLLRCNDSPASFRGTAMVMMLYLLFWGFALMIWGDAV